MPMPQPPFNSPIQTQPTIKGVVSIVNVWQNWLQLAQIYLANLTGSGPTSARPTTNLWVGQPFFDTTLNVPVYWDGNAWVTSAPSDLVTAVTGTAPISSSGGTTPNISITEANSTTNGYLSSTDWNTFNGKVASVSGNAPISSTGGANPVISLGNVKPTYNNLTNYSGTVARPITDMLGDYLSVLDFGADPTGATDSTSAFNTALSSSVLSGFNGGRVFVPPGNYSISGAINIPGGCSLIGSGRGCTYIKQTNTGADILTLTGTAANNYVSGFYLEYTSQSTTNDGIYISTPNVIIDDLYVQYANRAIVVDGNSSYDVTGVYISKCYILNFPTAGILVNNTSTHGVLDIYIDGIQSWAGAPDSASWATSGVLSLNGPVNVRASNSDLIGGAYPLLMNSTGGLDTIHAPQFCTFTNIYFDSGYYGATINGAIYSTFTNCWFSGGRTAGQAGLRIVSASATLISGGTHYGCGSHGLHLYSGANMTTVTGSAFNNNAATASGSGIFVEGNTYNFDITGCTASNVGPGGGSQSYGVYINSGCQNFSVTGNGLQGNAVDGLLDGTSYSSVKTIVGNSVPSNLNSPTGQDYQNVLGSRSLGTTYTNNRLSPMFVQVWCHDGGSNPNIITLTVNGTAVNVGGYPPGSGVTVCGFVPPGGNYVVTQAGGANAYAWTEC